MLTVYLLIGVAITYWVSSLVLRLQANIAVAKKSGIPYIIAPWSPVNDFHTLSRPIWVPIVKLLPKSWWDQWLDLMLADVFFKTKHAYFDKYGGMFLVVSPQRNHLVVANAEVINQIMNSLERFPKDIVRYDILRLFGENLLTADVATWRLHRKLISGSFNEGSAALVFHEATRQSKGMLDTWTNSSGERTGTLRTLEHDTMRLALHIISYVGFGLSLLWPEESVAKDANSKTLKYGTSTAPPGHDLSFADTIQFVLEKILFLLVLPARVLRWLPFKGARLAAQSHDDFAKYMSELMDEKIEEARSGSQERVGMDVMGQLIRSKNGQKSKANSEAGQDRTLSRAEIIGNAFLILLAGHETSANVLHFSIVELATNPASQRRLQKDIEELVGDADPGSWDYESLVNRMMASMLGACMNEMMRLMPPVVEVPKMVSSDHDQVVSMDGKKYTLAKDTSIAVLAVSVQRSVRYWPTQPSKLHPGKSDIDDFVPERWFQKPEAGDNESGEKNDKEGEDAETSPQLFRPTPGSYIPFSAGARSCIGRRIAQVEIVAMLAVIFQKYSVELAVDEWASDEEVSKMSKEEAQKVYEQAQKKSRDTLATATTLLTLKLQGNRHVPVRLVKKGEERFVSWVES